MYSCIDVNKLTTNPRINDISLDLLREYYETFCIHSNIII